MTGLRETSFRAISRVLRAPGVEAPLGLEGADLMPMDPDTHYLRCGAGLVIYNVRGVVAHMHGALLRGDGRCAREAWPQHKAYLRALGVSKITTRHRANHLAASVMCRALRFSSVPCDDGFKRYEKVI